MDSPIPDFWGNAQVICDICRKLWQNALDSMPDGGRLTFKTSLQRLDAPEENGGTKRSNGQDKSPANGTCPTSYLLLRVTDTGEGMDEKNKANMFRPFFTTKAGKSRGMGATAVYKAVKLHCGQVYVTSELGKGTCVDIHLPVSE